MSRIMKFYCDRCKKEYDPQDVSYKCETYMFRYKVLMESDCYEDKCDLCADCLEKLNKFMNLGDVKNEECTQDKLL